MNQAEFETHLEIRNSEFAVDLELPCEDCGKDSDAYTELTHDS